LQWKGQGQSNVHLIRSLVKLGWNAWRLLQKVWMECKPDDFRWPHKGHASDFKS